MRLPKVRTEMGVRVLTYNLTRALQIFAVVPLMKAIRASGAFAAQNPLCWNQARCSTRPTNMKPESARLNGH
jgi:hypothetical protein